MMFTIISYIVIGVVTGLIVGKILSGKSEEAVAWTFITMVCWPGVVMVVLAVVIFGAVGFLFRWLVATLGIVNAVRRR